MDRQKCHKKKKKKVDWENRTGEGPGREASREKKYKYVLWISINNGLVVNYQMQIRSSLAHLLFFYYAQSTFPS